MKGKTLVTIIGLALAASIATKGLSIRVVTPENIPPSVQVVDENNMKRFSYIPHGSLFRSAGEWYDRVVEDYTKTRDGNFELVRRTVVTYHYPILGLGEMSTSTESETSD